MTTHVEDALDTSYTLSDELYESNTSVTTESEQKDNDEDEQLERYNSNDNTLARQLYLSLLPLLRICQICFSGAKIAKFLSRGSNLIVNAEMQ